jgi:hypothetical protein
MAPTLWAEEVRTMGELLVWLIKLPFLLVALVLALVFALVGAILSVLGVVLTPVLGIGLLILPIGLVFLFIAGLIGRLFSPRTRVVVLR